MAAVRPTAKRRLAGQAYLSLPDAAIMPHNVLSASSLQLSDRYLMVRNHHTTLADYWHESEKD